MKSDLKQAPTRQKTPKLPVFPLTIEPMAQKLREIIDAGDDRFPLAYAALSRLCVIYAPNVGIDRASYLKIVRELCDLTLILFKKD